jgi:structural maintenance of chromosome 3 (chondroitin sulfate proteoglycan 6)
VFFWSPFHWWKNLLARSVQVTLWLANRRKQDIANMLETAGFSKSNPYYIVEQGKVRTPACLLTSSRHHGHVIIMQRPPQPFRLFLGPTRRIAVDWLLPLQVTRITTMKDKERLELLKEVAGTNVYEEKKDESIKIVRSQLSHR